MRRLCLVGYRSCGKSTLGPLVAARLRWPFVDLDQALTTRIAMPIAAYFTAHGESAFRDAETAELRTTLKKPSDLVLATGGGCVLREENRAIISEYADLCVYIKVPAAILSQRLRNNSGGRPSLTGGAVADEVAQVLAVRDPLYHAVADAVLDGTMPIVSLVTALVGLVENSG